MIAFKTFSQVPEESRPPGIPLSWPSEEMQVSGDQIIFYEQLGYAVVTDDQYSLHKSTHQAAYDAWALAYENSVVYWKIYDLVPYKKKYDTTYPPVDLDFRSSLNTMLHRKSYVVKGECIKEEYYQNCSVDSYGSLTYSNLIVSEHHAFTRDPLGFPVVRSSHIKYYDNKGAPSGPVKPWIKYYSTLEKIQEGKTRRSNLVDNLQMPVIGLIAIATSGSPAPTNQVILMGRGFLFDYKKEFDSFVDESNKEILYCLQNASNPRYMSASKYPWINSMTPYGVTIRQYLISELTI